MDRHSIRWMRDDGEDSGRPLKRFVYVEPDFKLQQVMSVLLDNRCSMAPIVTVDPDTGRVSTSYKCSKLSYVAFYLFKP